MELGMAEAVVLSQNLVLCKELKDDSLQILDISVFLSHSNTRFLGM